MTQYIFIIMKILASKYISSKKLQNSTTTAVNSRTSCKHEVRGLIGLPH